jgi:hypothetical protein
MRLESIITALISLSSNLTIKYLMEKSKLTSLLISRQQKSTIITVTERLTSINSDQQLSSFPSKMAEKQKCHQSLFSIVDA